MSNQDMARPGLPHNFTPSPADVDSLINRAGTHELGVDFLKTGSLDAVAAMFEVHAFVVDAAREKINGVSGDPGLSKSEMPAVDTLKTGKGLEIKA